MGVLVFLIEDKMEEGNKIVVHGLKQIIELNDHAYLVEMAIKEGIIEPTPATVRLTEKQLDELRRWG